MYISIYMHAYIYTYIYIYEFICIIYICIIYMYIHIYICICIYICVHIYVYIYMYIYIHTRRQWPFETAEKRTGLESWWRCGEVSRPAAALHIASGLHAAVRYLLRSGTRASVLKTSSSLEECLTSGRKGICGRSPERTPVAPSSVSWHRRVTSDLPVFEPDIGW